MAFTIVHKETGEKFVAESGKTVWPSKAGASSSYSQSSNYCRKGARMPTEEVADHGRIHDRKLAFGEQDVWVIKELVAEDESLLSKALLLLEECRGRVDYDTNKKITKFMESINE